MSNYSILFGFEKWVLQYLGFLVKTLCSSQLNECWKIERAFCALEHASYVHSLHPSYWLLFIDIFCALTLSNTVFSWSCVFFLFYFFLSTLRVMVRKTRAKKSSTSSSSDFQSNRFQFKSNQETYEKLNIFRFV